MMHVAIDPTERREAGPARNGATRPVPAKSLTAKPAAAKLPAAQAGRGRIVVLGALGCVALAGLSVAAYSALGSLAGPQIVRPNIFQMQKDQAASQAKAADWPDLKDGVPVLAGDASGTRMQAASVSADQVNGAKIDGMKAEEVKLAGFGLDGARAGATRPPVPESATPPVAVERPVEKPATLAAAAPTPVAALRKALPQIEPAGVAPAPKAVSPIAPGRTAALIAPNPSQTTRARAAETTFASLPPEPVPPAKPVDAVEKPKLAKAAVTKAPVAKTDAVKTAAIKTPASKPVQQASAEPPAAVAEPEAEHSDVFGLKMPSLAPAGRKIAEGVEALGNAVKNLPNPF